MGIGRRKFLSLCGTGFAAFAATSNESIAIVDDLYVNRQFGVAFRKPPGWQFMDVKRMGEIAAGQILATEDFELTPDVLEWIGMPFVVVQREPLADRTFTPCAQFFLLADCPLFDEIDDCMVQLRQLMGELPPDHSSKPRMLKKALEDAEVCGEQLKSFTVLEKPKEMVLSKCPSAAYTAEYLFEHKELPTAVRVRVKTIYSLHGDLSYLIRLIDSPYTNPPAEFCFDSLVSSIAYV